MQWRSGQHMCTRQFPAEEESRACEAQAQHEHPPASALEPSSLMLLPPTSSSFSALLSEMAAAI